MNAYELQALRHIFAMTIDECATWIAQTGDSESWRQWENGKCAIPDCVVEQLGNDSNLLIVFYVQIMPDDLVMQLHRF
ncbi:putative alpha-mannosidase [Shigella flexneri]|uniref:Putative alpha-mannosidase n=2 Tax=Shigella flexneri TaxID=623 RepID=A0A380AVE0_SHIFL|nr:putative alpha-mannosidase [Shigella flexneri]